MNIGKEFIDQISASISNEFLVYFQKKTGGMRLTGHDFCGIHKTTIIFLLIGMTKIYEDFLAVSGEDFIESISDLAKKMYRDAEIDKDK